MGPSELGLVRGFAIDSSVLVSAEREKLSATEVIRNVRLSVGEVPITICALTIAEPGHGIYHTANEAKAQHRRSFLNDLKQHVPIHPITGVTGEIIARVSGEQASRGITVPIADLIIGCCALELDYAIATQNVRHFRLIPDLDVRQF